MEKLKLLFKGFIEGFHEFGFTVSTILNFVLLSIVFIFGIGLVSIYTKLTNKKVLPLKAEIQENSYWTNKKNRNATIEDSLKPF